MPLHCAASLQNSFPLARLKQTLDGDYKAWGQSPEPITASELTAHSHP